MTFPFRRTILAALAAVFLIPVVSAGAGAPVRVDPVHTFVEKGWRKLDLSIALSEAVPYRLTLLADPPRLAIDLRGVDLGAFNPDQLRADEVSATVEPAPAGWSRLVLRLDRPRLVAEALLSPDDPVLRVKLAPASDKEFAARAQPAPGPVLSPRIDAGRPQRLLVMLDPGHGGIDPGAEHGGTNEARLMLTFATELRALLEAAGYDVAQTRDTDVFIPLESRISRAHEAGAGVFMSLHADALAEGQATGATVYTLSEAASDRASAQLAERHDRDDIISGVDLKGHDDGIARILVDLARTDTRPRSEALADELVAAIGAGAGPLYKTPRRGAGFSVLKSPSIPSVLVELGYLSNPADFARISDPAWRARMARAIVGGLDVWTGRDAGTAALRRR